MGDVRVVSSEDFLWLLCWLWVEMGGWWWDVLGVGVGVVGGDLGLGVRLVFW